MAIGVGNLVSATDFNNIYNKINKVLGDDGVDEQVGYGRALTSYPVSSGDGITADLLEKLYNDMVKARTHQLGTNFTWSLATDGLNAPDTGEYIGSDAADIGSTNSLDATTDLNEGFIDFDQAATDIVNGKDLFNAAQVSEILQQSATRSTAWNNSLVHTLDLVFNDANERRYFFNSGGIIKINASLTGGTSVAGDVSTTPPGTKDEIWQTMLKNMGEIIIGKNSTAPTGTGTGTSIGNYQLTTNYQTIFQKDGSGVYSENSYTIEARLEDGIGAGGLPVVGNKIRLRITFTDADLGDDTSTADGFPGQGTPVDENVTGTLNSSIRTRAATGVLGISHPGSVEVSNLSGGALATSYVLATDSTFITEGSGSVSITLNTTGLANGTNVPYTISGISASDLASGSMTGNFPINNNTATLAFSFEDDGIVEGTETMTLSLDNGQASININIVDAGAPVPTYSITNPSPNVIAEGSTGTFTVTTTNVSDGTVLYWTLANLTTTNDDFDAVQGTVTINSNNGTIDVTPTADGTTEGQESFILRLRTTGYSGTIVAEGGVGTTVGDTSLDTIELTGGDIVRERSTTDDGFTVNTTIDFNSDGTIVSNGNTAGNPTFTDTVWGSSGSGTFNGSLYEIRATFVGGFASNIGDTVGQWLSLDQTRTFGRTDGTQENPGSARSTTLTIDIRDVATGTIRTTDDITLTANYIQPATSVDIWPNAPLGGQWGSNTRIQDTSGLDYNCYSFAQLNVYNQNTNSRVFLQGYTGDDAAFATEQPGYINYTGYTNPTIEVRFFESNVTINSVGDEISYSPATNPNQTYVSGTWYTIAAGQSVQFEWQADESRFSGNPQGQGGAQESSVAIVSADNVSFEVRISQSGFPTVTRSSPTKTVTLTADLYSGAPL